jgi:hypothetical protein
VEPHTLWEYRRENPTKATVYLTSALCMPRLAILYVWLVDYDDTLGRVAASRTLVEGRSPVRSMYKLVRRRRCVVSSPKRRRADGIPDGSALACRGNWRNSRRSSFHAMPRSWCKDMLEKD